MKIAFITPSPTVLKHDWCRNLLYQKVGVPNLAGYLNRAGFPDIEHYDFNNHIIKAYAKDPGLVKLMLYTDQAAVERFLRADDREIRRQTEFFLNALKMERKDMFGISLTHFLGDDLEIKLGIRLAQCLAKAMKERFPDSVIALGGLQNMALSFQEAEYRKILRECPAIDYAVCGNAHKAILNICKAVEKKISFRDLKVKGLNFETINKSVFIQEKKTGDWMKGSQYFSALPDSEVRNHSVPYGFPAYDKANSAAYRYTGRQIRHFYHLPDSLKKRLKRGAQDDYLTLHVSFSEGCPFNCFFCANARTELVSLDTGEAIRILKTLKEELGCRHFLFYNPNFNPTYKYARNFLEQLIKADLGILWADCFNLRNMDRELIAMMRAAGTIKVISGVEYPTKRMLKYINKGLTPEKIYRNLEDLHKAGIWNHVLLITGMPTETWADVREMEDWLKATKDLVNSYTVGSFHMAEGSPFYRNPEKFGFKLKEAMRLYCQSSFDEKDGLDWQEKEIQNQRSNQHIRQFIDELKGSRKPTAARMDDSHLLMYLYRMLGHDRKKTIEELYEAAYTVNPHITSAYAHMRGQLARPRSQLNTLLRRNEISLKLGFDSHESLAFTLEKGRAEVACSVLARSEDILINPADNRVHGDYFVLQAEEHGADAPQNAKLKDLIGRLGGKLTVENVPTAADGKIILRLATDKGDARFILSTRPPAFRYEVFAKSLNSALLDKIGGLLLAVTATRKKDSHSIAGELLSIKKSIPKILNIVESWQ
ncbi:MAG: hypothetical protein A2234_03205 [Elusimicrobia bacterium RIFOXYA2_FULL_58_8]|nr:MAG: hypothetical protein A2285_02560 [Elusimicrobia bacterium RIFOXYA12_FULL_57_11]OGS17259.1 MAG: hypothetical protein A2234_03205 [Elusimicrobia bacterium RIFOXYA2_FULL_58_8]